MTGKVNRGGQADGSGRTVLLTDPSPTLRWSFRGIVARPRSAHPRHWPRCRSARSALAPSPLFSACPLGWRCGRWTVVRGLRPDNVLDPEAPSWRWPVWPQSFRGSRRRGVGPAQRSGRRLAIGLPVGERSSARPTQACGPCLLVVVIPPRTSFTVGPATSVTSPGTAGGRSVQRPHCSGPDAPPTLPHPDQAGCTARRRNAGFAGHELTNSPRRTSTTPFPVACDAALTSAALVVAVHSVACQAPIRLPGLPSRPQWLPQPGRW